MAKQKLKNIIAPAAFTLFAYLLLALGYGDYMRKCEALSLFLPTPMYFDQCMSVPGGLVTWISTFLTQFMYYPWVGAAIFAALLVVIQWGTLAAFGLKGPWKSLSVILAALVLLAYVNLGYLIFTLRPGGFAFSLAVGLSIVLCITLVYKAVRQWWLQAIAMLAITAIGYHYLGAYALLTAAACAICTIIGKGRVWQKSAVVALAVAAAVIVPRLWYEYIGGNLMHSQVYLSGLPQFYASDVPARVLYALTIALFLLLAISPAIPMRRASQSTWGTYAPIGSTVLAIAIVLIYRNDDANLRTTLALDRALWEQNWDKAVEIAENIDTEPTRLNTVLAQIALMRSGKGGDRLFSIPYGWATYATSRDTRPIHDAGGALIAYHLGLINYAHRWSMEYSIAQCMSAERLKMLAKCALLNEEPTLAKTYLDILYNLPNHRAWAKKYLRYAAEPMEIANDKELLTISRLMCHPNQFINDRGAYESYIWPLLTEAPEGSPDFNELSMQAALITRDLDHFMAKLPLYQGPRLPRYYQEAALLWSMLSHTPCPVAIDPVIENHHQQFLEAFRNTSSLEAERQKELMAKDFGDTYWYYYVFTANQPMI